ncbi:hypothetical protein IT570_01615 [Candidatus Sumerlaeota bacterium]|nr:hypothetical protein [Candidatus Sumerlaeota bacterium]
MRGREKVFDSMIHPLAALIRFHELQVDAFTPVGSKLPQEALRLQQAMSPTLQQYYPRLFQRYGSTAVVPLRRGICTGCHVRHPAGASKLAEGVSQCQNCNRLVYDADEAFELCVG